MEIAKQIKMSENVLSTRCIYGSDIIANCPVRSGFSPAELYPETLVEYCELCHILQAFQLKKFAKHVKIIAKKEKK